MANYEYVKTDGTLGTTDNQANAPGIAPTSGFSLSSVNSSNLTPTNPVNVPAYTPPQTQTPSVEDLIKQSELPTADTNRAQTGVDDTLSRIKSLYDFQGKKASEQSRFEQEAGIPDLQNRLNEINNQIRGINASAFQATQNAEGRRAPTFLIYGEQAQIERQRSAQTYGLAAASQALQGNIALANDNVKRALDSEFGAVESQLAYQRDLLNVNRDNLSKAEQKQAKLLDIRLNERASQIASQKADKNAVYQIMTTAAQNGADNATLQRITQSPTGEAAVLAAGSFIRPPSVPKAPEVKTINGVDMIWNPTTRQFEPINTAQSAQLADKTIKQLDFILEAARGARGLADKAGTGVIEQTVTGALGGSKYKQLVAYANTLKTNMLTLATDPSIKKFFGPQMSNADVLLMTSAGTTLNPENQSPEQLRAEIRRIESFILRAKAAVASGASQEQTTGGQIITAPNGDQVQITD